MKDTVPSFSIDAFIVYVLVKLALFTSTPRSPFTKGWISPLANVRM
jgi:hypothetical protein